jgi:hypothetical protein
VGPATGNATLRRSPSVSTPRSCATTAGPPCRELSAAAASAVERQEKRPCGEAVLRLDLPAGVAAGASRVYLTSASVDLADGSSAFLSEGPAGWKISAAGCTPSAPDRPYDCELEA